MKPIKSIAVLLSVLIIGLTAAVPAFAESIDDISIRFNDDIAGLTFEDKEQLAEILSDGLEFENRDLYMVVQINDITGNVWLEPVKAGITYTISYAFKAKDGFELPESLEDTSVEMLCADGCEVYWYSLTQGRECDVSLTVYTTVTVKGNLFQRIFGWLADTIQKIMSWSPY